jgi:aldehyde:ferredoxin oxidoreductase
LSALVSVIFRKISHAHFARAIFSAHRKHRPCVFVSIKILVGNDEKTIRKKETDMKMLRVDMSQRSTRMVDMPEMLAGLGGRGLTAALVHGEVPPECDPLGPENRLVIAPVLLSGTVLVNTGRVSIGAKSPLTGGIKESNAGGTAAVALAGLGIGAVVVEGQAGEQGCFVLRMDGNGDVSLISAENLRGLRTYALVEKLQGMFGRKNAILCIGPAGEYQMLSASIQSTDVDGRPCRAAGRGGLGAVMGAKGLKAVVIEHGGKAGDAPAEPERFREAAKVIAASIKENPFTGIMLPAQGTACLVGMVNAMGAFPSRNATGGVMDGWENLSGDRLAETIQQRGGKPSHMGCSQCIMHCSNEFVDEGGQYVTSSLEYETIWSMGGMTGIADLDAVARLDFLADDIGLDTMNTGVAMGVAMDAGYRSFGDADAAMEMMAEIAAGSQIGMVLGNGPASVGAYFGHHRVPVVKGQSIAAYDPRGMQGNGVTYATSPMGADHTAGNLVGEYLGGKLNPTGTEGQVAASREAQIAMAAIDCTGLCLLAAGALGSPEAVDALMTMLEIRTGIAWSAEKYHALGVRVLRMELDFNRRAGLTEADDRLPAFFLEEPLPPHNVVFGIDSEALDSTLKF